VCFERLGANLGLGNVAGRNSVARKAATDGHLSIWPTPGGEPGEGLGVVESKSAKSLLLEMAAVVCFL